MDKPIPMQETEILEAFRLLELAEESDRSRLRRQATRPKQAPVNTYTDSSTTVVSPPED